MKDRTQDRTQDRLNRFFSLWLLHGAHRAGVDQEALDRLVANRAMHNARLRRERLQGRMGSLAATRAGRWILDTAEMGTAMLDAWCLGYALATLERAAEAKGPGEAH